MLRMDSSSIMLAVVVVVVVVVVAAENDVGRLLLFIVFVRAKQAR